MDVWELNLFPASFDGQLLDIEVTEDQLNKALAIHEVARRDGGLVQWMGGDVRSTHCRVYFFEREPDPDDPLAGDDHLTRLQFFVNTAAAADEPREFVHPLFGSYQAFAQNIRLRASAGERDVVVVEVDFIESSEFPTLIDIGVTTPVEAGTAVLEVTNDLARAEAESLGVDYSLDQTVDTVRAWESDPDLSARQVNQELGRESARIAQFAASLEGSLENQVLFRLVTRMHAQLRKAADTFRFERARVVEVTLDADTSLRWFVTHRYGASQAEQRYAEVMQLNDISNPLLIPAGTVLRVHSKLRPGQARLQGFPLR